MSDNRNESELLENRFLFWIGSISIFIIAGIALFNFTEKGHIFSIISLIISLFITIIALFDYLSKRQELLQKGVKIRAAVDLLAACILAAIILISWVIYEVYQTDPVLGFTFPLSFIAGEIEMVGEQVAKALEKKIQNKK